MKAADVSRGQLFARVPAALMTEVEASAARNYRNVSGEMLAALDSFVQLHLERDHFLGEGFVVVDHQWRYENWPSNDVKPINVKAVPQTLLDRFHLVAARYKGDGQAFTHALELWVGGQAAAAEEFKYASG